MTRGDRVLKPGVYLERSGRGTEAWLLRNGQGRGAAFPTGVELSGRFSVLGLVVGWVLGLVVGWVLHGKEGDMDTFE